MRMPTVRSLMVSAVAGSVAVGIGVLLLGVVDVLAIADAIQISVGVACLGVLAAILVGQRRVDGKVQRLTRSHRKHADSTTMHEVEAELRARMRDLAHQMDEIAAALGEDRVMFAAHSGDISSGLSGVEDRVASKVADLSTRVSELSEGTSELSRGLSELRPRLDKLAVEMKALERSGEVGFKQLEAYVDLRGLIQPRAPMPALRGWAASPDVMRLLAETLWLEHPKLIVECGSGSSSVWLGYFAQHNGSARVVALEHDERYLEISRDLVRAHGLADVVEIRHAPLIPWEGEGATYLWYDTEAIEDLTDTGLLFVDGPPRQAGPHARFPAMPLLLPRCAHDVVIVLDDSLRDEESAISDQWLAAYPDLQRSVRQFDKGAHVFTRRAT